MKKGLVILFVFVILSSFIYAQENQTITCSTNEDCGQSSVSKYCDNLQACTFDLTPTCHKYPNTTEGFCLDNKMGGCTPCQYTCQNGECIAPASTICTDTDGTNHFAAGKTCIGSTCELDKCEGNTVIEYACRDNNILVDHNYGCINGCSEGACLPETTSETPVTCTQKENTCCKGNICRTLLACDSSHISL